MTPRRQLRSSTSYRLKVPPFVSLQSASGRFRFWCHPWNDLPLLVRQRLQTFLFSRSYQDTIIWLVLLLLLLQMTRLKWCCRENAAGALLQDYNKGEISECQSKLWTNRNVFSWCLNWMLLLHVPFITTVWTPEVLAVINIIVRSVWLMVMMMMMMMIMYCAVVFHMTTYKTWSSDIAVWDCQLYLSAMLHLVFWASSGP